MGAIQPMSAYGKGSNFKLSGDRVCAMPVIAFGLKEKIEKLLAK
jgi:hypothetical protein